MKSPLVLAFLAVIPLVQSGSGRVSHTYLYPASDVGCTSPPIMIMIRPAESSILPCAEVSCQNMLGDGTPRMIGLCKDEPDTSFLAGSDKTWVVQKSGILDSVIYVPDGQCVAALGDMSSKLTCTENGISEKTFKDASCTEERLMVAKVTKVSGDNYCVKPSTKKAVVVDPPVTQNNVKESSTQSVVTTQEKKTTTEASSTSTGDNTGSSSLTTSQQKVQDSKPAAPEATGTSSQSVVAAVVVFSVIAVGAGFLIYRSRKQQQHYQTII
jgi:hypothetical protein